MTVEPKNGSRKVVMFKAKRKPNSSKNECRNIAEPSDKEEENFERKL